MGWPPSVLLGTAGQATKTQKTTRLASQHKKRATNARNNHILGGQHIQQKTEDHSPSRGTTRPTR